MFVLNMFWTFVFIVWFSFKWDAINDFKVFTVIHGKTGRESWERFKRVQLSETISQVLVELNINRSMIIINSIKQIEHNLRLKQ